MSLAFHGQEHSSGVYVERQTAAAASSSSTTPYIDINQRGLNRSGVIYSQLFQKHLTSTLYDVYHTTIHSRIVQSLLFEVLMTVCIVCRVSSVIGRATQLT